MRSLLLALVLLPFASYGAPAPSTDFQAASRQISPAKLEHPYLLFTRAEVPQMLQRFKANQDTAEIWEKYQQDGRRLLNAAVETEGPARLLHTRFVGTDEYRRWVAEHTEAAVTLAFLYQMTGDARYATKAFENADVVCGQESWVQSAHYFPIIYSRVWPIGAKDDQVVFTYDITAAATSRQMAYVYDWIYSAMTKSQRDRLRGALLDKAITRVRGNYEYFWWANAYRCNWTGICHSGLGLAALALLKEDPQLVDVVARSCQGVTALLDNIGEDGGWQEGRGYWAFGLGESVRFMDAVRRVTGGSVDLFKHRSLAKHTLDFGLFGLTAGFGDGSGAPVGESFIMNKLAQESGDPTAAYYIQNFVRRGETIADLVWPLTTVKPEAPQDGSRFFKSIDWAVLRKDFSYDSVVVATKAGLNDDPHHGHLDCGTFNLTWQGLPYIGEVPRSSYDEHYFGAERWDYLEARTSGHNCVLVNGEEQVVAKLKDQPWQQDIGGHITFYASEPSWAGVAMDPTRAYPGKELKTWNRWIAIDKERNVVVVLDKVQAAPGARVEVRFHPGVEFDLADGGVKLRPRARAELAREGATSHTGEAERAAGVARANADAATRRVNGMTMQAFASAPLTLVKGRQPDVPVTKQAQTLWVPYYSTVVQAQKADTFVASVFSPTAVAGEANAITSTLDTSGTTPVVSYTVGGRTTRLEFAKAITRTAQ